MAATSGLQHIIRPRISELVDQGLPRRDAVSRAIGEATGRIERDDAPEASALRKVLGALLGDDDKALDKLMGALIGASDIAAAVALVTAASPGPIGGAQRVAIVSLLRRLWASSRP